jgi:hypothetical protein
MAKLTMDLLDAGGQGVEVSPEAVTALQGTPYAVRLETKTTLPSRNTLWPPSLAGIYTEPSQPYTTLKPTVAQQEAAARASWMRQMAADPTNTPKARKTFEAWSRGVNVPANTFDEPVDPASEYARQDFVREDEQRHAMDLARLNAALRQPPSGGPQAQGTPQSRQQYAVRNAMAVIDELEEMSLGPLDTATGERRGGINAGQGLPQLVGGLIRSGAGYLNLDDAALIYNRSVSGFMPLIARAMGHTGVLTQQDVDSVRGLFPGMTRNRTLAQGQYALLRKIIAAGSVPLTRYGENDTTGFAVRLADAIAAAKAGETGTTSPSTVLMWDPATNDWVK